MGFTRFYLTLFLIISTNRNPFDEAGCIVKVVFINLYPIGNLLLVPISIDGVLLVSLPESKICLDIDFIKSENNNPGLLYNGFSHRCHRTESLEFCFQNNLT